MGARTTDGRGSPMAQPDRFRSPARRGPGPTHPRLGPHRRGPHPGDRVRRVRGRHQPPVPVFALATLRSQGGHRTALDLYATRPHALGLPATAMAEMFVRRATQLLYGADETRAGRYQLAVSLVSRCLHLALPDAEDLLVPHLDDTARTPSSSPSNSSITSPVPTTPSQPDRRTRRTEHAEDTTRRRPRPGGPTGRGGPHSWAEAQARSPPSEALVGAGARADESRWPTAT